MRRFLLTACVFLISPSAFAASVVNMADAPRMIEVEYSGGYRPVLIAPGRSFQLIGRMNVRYKGREASIDDNETYAIWNDGTFGPQYKRRYKGL